MRILLSFVVAATCVACAEQPAMQKQGTPGGAGQSPTPSTSNGTVSPSTQPSANVTYDVCPDLTSKLGSVAGMAPLIQQLCASGKLASLRTGDYQYTFSGDTAALFTASEQNVGSDSIRLVVISSMSTPATPANYMAMTRMQIQNPTQFSAKGFKYAAGTRYVPSNTAADRTSYTYFREASGGEQINYSSIATFTTLKEGVAYAVTTDLQQPLDGSTLRDLLGLSVIVQRDSNYVDVFGVSDQTYVHQGRQAETKNSVINGLKEEQVRAWENGRDSAKASQ